jgi:hypothetical protein
MSHLTTVPSFVFWQSTEEDIEEPVQVSYYNGTIELKQGDNDINIHPALAKALFKEILKHQPEAEKWLNKR